MQEQRIADRLAVIVLNFRQWSGETVLMKEDFTIGDGGQLPPQEVAHWGCKRICDPKELKVFGTIKQRAVRLLADVGVPFLGGIAIPLSKADTIVEKLDNMVAQYDNAKQDFLSRYDDIVSDWIAKNPEFSSELIQGSKTKSYVESRIKAEYSVFRVQPLDNDANNFSQAESDLGDKLLDEVSKTARELFKNSFAGKTSVTGRALSPIRAMRDRLMGLSFLDGTILPIVKTIDDTIASISPKGPYEAGNFHALNALVGILCDPIRMRQLSTVVAQQSTSDDPEDFQLCCTQETVPLHGDVQQTQSEQESQPEPEAAQPTDTIEADPEDELAAFFNAAGTPKTEPQTIPMNTVNVELPALESENDSMSDKDNQKQSQPQATPPAQIPNPVKEVSISEAACDMVFW